MPSDTAYWAERVLGYPSELGERFSYIGKYIGECVIHPMDDGARFRMEIQRPDGEEAITMDTPTPEVRPLPKTTWEGLEQGLDIFFEKNRWYLLDTEALEKREDINEQVAVGNILRMLRPVEAIKGKLYSEK
jgi:hypothetical protein